jgi:hypothetical protein
LLLVSSKPSRKPIQKDGQVWYRHKVGDDWCWGK